MNTPIFNFHDIALVLIAGQCSLLAILFLANRGARPLSHIFLACFLLLNAMCALHTLMLWGEAIRFRVFDVAPNIFFVFSFAFFLQGPVLYWYTQTLVYKDITFTPRQLWHLLPTLLTPLYLYWVYYRHELEIKRGLALDFKIYGSYDWNFNWFVHAQKLILLVYGLLCLYEVLRYRQLIKHRYSNTEAIELNWLLLVTGGFLFTWTWIFITHVIGYAHYYALGGVMGVMGNYFTCILINLLLFYSLFTRTTTDAVTVQVGDSLAAGAASKEQIDPAHIARLTHAMQQQQLYLNSRLTLEEFARRVELPPRVVSMVINRHFGQNFHEFVNRARVDAAQTLLRTHAQQPIMDIATAVGFNSKPAFNRFFKKFTGMTPSEYRELPATERAPPV